MFKLHKPQMSGSIHSGHFMVSRLDDDEDDDNNDPADDSSESERDNANSVEIDINNPESVADATNNLDLSYRVESPAAAKDEKLTSWNDLDRPQKHAQKQHQYLTYYTNSCQDGSKDVGSNGEGGSGSIRAPDSSASSQVVVDGRLSSLGGVSSRINVTIEDRIASMNESSSKDSQARGFNSHLNHLHQHHHTLQDQYQHLQLANPSGHHNNHHQQHQSPLNQYQHHHQHHHYQHHHNSNHHQHPHHYQHTVTIDTTLTKLLECMSLYYSSNLTSPKWKSFKGFKLRLKYKIRLNNLIWRAWFLQCIRGRRPPGCRFNAPVETDVHKKSETIVLEGKYWKRKEKAILDEYKKWRIFHKQKSQTHCFRPSSFDWDSRVSNLASSSMHGPECSFYPDYDMNITCNLDDFPPMLEDIESPREYVQPAAIRMSDQQQQQQQQQHHQHQQQQHQHQQQLQHHQQQQQQQHQLQFAQMQVTAAAAAAATATATITTGAQQALSLKREQPLLVSFSSQNQAPQLSQQNLYQHHQQQVIQAAAAANYSQSQPQTLQLQNPHIQPHQPQPLLRPPIFPIGFDNNPLYQHLNEHLQHQHHHHHHQPQQHPQHQQHQAAVSQPQPISIPSHQQQQQHSQPTSSSNQQQQQQQQQNVMIMSPDIYPMSQGSNGDCSSGSSNADGSGRNEQRRVCHINAEQKRRCNIKNGFDTLKSILPSINQNVNVKISKASMLQKAASYISALSAEQNHQAEEQALLKQQIESLKQTINAYQCQLPASGGPVGCPGSSQARELLQEHIRRRTLDNWKFWIFSLLIEPLFESYYNSVSTTSLEDACKTIFTWLDRCCGLISLRKDVLESLTFLSTKTNILNTPQTLPTEAVDAVRFQQQQAATNSTPATATTTTSSSSLCLSQGGIMQISNTSGF